MNDKLKILKEILSFRELEKGWDTYNGVPAPEESILLAIRALLRLVDEGVDKDHCISTDPLDRGGVIIRVHDTSRNDDYVYIEVDDEIIIDNLLEKENQYLYNDICYVLKPLMYR